MAKILVIEDEADIQHILEFNLQQGGHKVTLAGRADEGLRLAREKKPDLVLLDLMLPDMSGTEVCRQIKSDPQLKGTQVIILTAKGEEIDRVVGFELGADDYVVKPFSVRELSSASRPSCAGGRRARAERIRSVACSRSIAGPTAVGPTTQELELTALEFKLLVTLFDRKNRVQSRAALLNDVWGIEADITTRTVDTHVKRLREKLGTGGRLHRDRARRRVPLRRESPDGRQGDHGWARATRQGFSAFRSRSLALVGTGARRQAGSRTGVRFAVVVARVRAASRRSSSERFGACVDGRASAPHGRREAHPRG
jgi:two-component system phosphate regulon response regulator PhoB